MNQHELFALQGQNAANQSGTLQFAMMGYISTYDPITHSIKAFVPALRDADDIAQETGYVQLGTHMAGPGWGSVYAPVGGATAKNPTGGEPVLLSTVYRDGGLHVTSAMMFNNVSFSPGGSIPLNGGAPINPGETYFVNKFGTQVYLRNNGDIDIVAAGDLNLTGTDVNETASQEINLTAGTVLNLTAPAINAGSRGETKYFLVTDLAWEYLLTHTHGGVQPGAGNTGAPNGAPANAYPYTTQVLQAG